MNCSKLYYEHLIPIYLIKNALCKCSITKEEIENIMNSNEVVVLTKDEANNLDKKYKSRIPDNDDCRLDAAEI